MGSYRSGFVSLPEHQPVHRQATLLRDFDHPSFRNLPFSPGLADGLRRNAEKCRQLGVTMQPRTGEEAVQNGIVFMSQPIPDS